MGRQGKTRNYTSFSTVVVRVWVLLEFKGSIAEGSPFKRLQTGIWIYWIVLELLEKNRQTDRYSERQKNISGRHGERNEEDKKLADSNIDFTNLFDLICFVITEEDNTHFNLI